MIKFKCPRCRKTIPRSEGYVLNGQNLCKVDYWKQFPATSGEGRFILDKPI